MTKRHNLRWLMGVFIALSTMIPIGLVHSQPDDTHGPADKIAVSGDGQTIAVRYTSDYTRYPIEFFDMRSQALVHSIDPYIYNFADFALSPKGDRLIAIRSGRGLALYTRADQSLKVINESSGHAGSFRGVYWSPVDASLIALIWGGSVEFMNVDTDKFAGRVKSNFGNINSASFSPDGSHMVTSAYGRGSDRFGLEIWKIPQDETISEPLVTLEDKGGGSVVWSPDGERIAALGGVKFLVYNVKEKRIEVEDIGTQDGDDLIGISWSPDSKYIATGGDFLRVWDTSDYTSLGKFSESYVIAGPVWSPDGKRIYTNDKSDEGMRRDVIPLPGVTPDPTPDAAPAQAVTSFTLVDADTDEDIRPLTNTDTITQGTFTIRANTTPPTVGSVVFGLNNTPRFNVENTPVYALKGDVNGDYHPWQPKPGTYTLTATPYTEANGQGEAGTPLTITFTVVNRRPPIANAGPDQTVYITEVTEEAEVQLDGRGSQNPDGGGLIYEWSEGTTQVGTGSQPRVRLGRGTHTITLTVTDAQTASAASKVSDTVIITVKRKPIANAGPDQTVYITEVTEEAEVLLDGNQSQNPDGGGLMLRWYKGKAEVGRGPTPSVRLGHGKHTLTLTVWDEEMKTDASKVSDTVTITVKRKPIANAGPDDIVHITENKDKNKEKAEVLLDGRQSQNPDGGGLIYVWYKGTTQVGTGSQPRVQLGPGEHTLTLTVTDAQTASAASEVSDTVIITVNRNPVARAWKDNVNETLHISGGLTWMPLNGLRSYDPDGDTLSYVWREGSRVLTRQGSGKVLLAPGVHRITLEVMDGRGGKDSVEILITVNRRPIANPGPNKTYHTGGKPLDVRLDGRKSKDPDGRIVSYVWKQGNRTVARSKYPLVSLSVGVHTFTLTVKDNRDGTASNTVTITVNGRPTVHPTSNVRGNKVSLRCTNTHRVTLKANADANGPAGDKITNYVWGFGGKVVSRAHQVSLDLGVGTHIITVRAYDSHKASAIRGITITVSKLAVPCKLKLLNPGHRSTQRRAVIVLEWQKDPGSTAYDIHVTDSGRRGVMNRNINNSVVVTTQVSASKVCPAWRNNKCQYAVYADEAGWHKWKVRGVRGGSVSAWSERMFYVSAPRPPAPEIESARGLLWKSVGSQASYYHIKITKNDASIVKDYWVIGNNSSIVKVINGKPVVSVIPISLPPGQYWAGVSAWSPGGGGNGIETAFKWWVQFKWSAAGVDVTKTLEIK